MKKKQEGVKGLMVEGYLKKDDGEGKVDRVDSEESIFFLVFNREERLVFFFLLVLSTEG